MKRSQKDRFLLYFSSFICIIYDIIVEFSYEQYFCVKRIVIR